MKLAQMTAGRNATITLKMLLFFFDIQPTWNEQEDASHYNTGGTFLEFGWIVEDDVVGGGERIEAVIELGFQHGGWVEEIITGRPLVDYSGCAGDGAVD